jgi:hypothetical protein
MSKGSPRHKLNVCVKAAGLRRISASAHRPTASKQRDRRQKQLHGLGIAALAGLNCWTWCFGEPAEQKRRALHEERVRLTNPHRQWSPSPMFVLPGAQRGRARSPTLSGLP